MCQRFRSTSRASPPHQHNNGEVTLALALGGCRRFSPLEAHSLRCTRTSRRQQDFLSVPPGNCRRGIQAGRPVCRLRIAGPETPLRLAFVYSTSAISTSAGTRYHFRGEGAASMTTGRGCARLTDVLQSFRAETTLVIELGTASTQRSSCFRFALNIRHEFDGRLSAGFCR